MSIQHMKNGTERQHRKWRLNSEWLFVSVVVALLAAVLYSVSVESQPANEMLSLPSYSGSPSGLFGAVAVGRFTDYGNNSYYIVPSGTSQMNNITIQQDASGSGGYLEMQNGSIIQGQNGDQSIDLNNTGGGFSMDVYALTTIAGVTMGAASATGGNAKYIYDIAEGMSCRKSEAGDVVTIAPCDGMLVPAAQAYSRPIAGVVSGEPKLYMGRAPDKQALALGGIVKCKAVTENGPISRGDLLVSSSVAGHAMRADSSAIKPGMLVGMALEPLEAAQGKIHILVNKH